MTSETREEEREWLREEFEEELGNLADAARDTTWLVDGSHARRDRAHAWLLARYDAMAADAERLDWLEELLDALLTERDALAQFAAKALDALRGVNIGNHWDGGDAQAAMLACGLLEPFTATEACGEDCACAEIHDFPQECYRLSALGQGVRQTP